MVYHLFTLFYSFNYFPFGFHHYHLVLLSSNSYITTAFMLAFGYHGLEIKILYYCTLYALYIKYTESQPLVEDVCLRQVTLDV